MVVAPSTVIGSLRVACTPGALHVRLLQFFDRYCSYARFQMQ